jgi:hypothetical protein
MGFETRRQQETASLDRLLDFLVGPSNGHGPTIAEIRHRTLEHPDDCSVLKVSIPRLNPQTAFDLWSIGLKSNIRSKGIEGN